MELGADAPLPAGHASSGQGRAGGRDATAPILGGIGNFWEKLGTLGHRGHLDTVLLWDGFGSASVVTWSDLEPFVQRDRELTGDPRSFEHVEWLAGRMNELDRRARAEPLSQEVYAPLSDGRLAALEEKLRVEVALRLTKPSPPQPHHVVARFATRAPPPLDVARRGREPPSDGNEL